MVLITLRLFDLNDALGRRLAKTASGLVTTFVHDGAQVIDEYESPALASSTINAPTVPGYFSDNAAGTITLASGGTNISNTGDQFRYAYTMLTGDGSITTRITSQTNTNVAAKAGVMIRESLTWNSKHAALLMTPTNGVEFQQRSTTSAVATSTTAAASGPLWLKLTRSGTTITAAWSVNGTTWTTANATMMFPATPIYLGLAVVSANAGTASTATFTNLATSGNTRTDATPALARTYVYGSYVDELLATQTSASNNDISGYTLCANEWDSFALPSTCDVAYGANGAFAFRAAQSGTITINNATFGDPAPGTPKKGYYRLSGGQRFYAHANHLYSVAALTNQSGVVVERYRYDTYGQRTVLAADGVTVRSGSLYGNQRGFTGYYEDKETGMYYARTRMYSAGLGRFINRSPWRNLSGTVYSNYDHIVIPDEWKKFINNALRGIGAKYLGGRFNSYDRAMGSPANFLEPFSDAKALENLKEEEGLRLDVYTDTTGNQTIGYGHNLSSSSGDGALRDLGYNPDSLRNGTQSLTQEDAEKLLKKDAETARDEARNVIPNYNYLCPSAQRVLKEMAFQLGGPSLSKFRKMIAALGKEPPDYCEAADEMLDSRWAREQSPARAERKAAEMKMCCYRCYYDEEK